MEEETLLAFAIISSSKKTRGRGMLKEKRGYFRNLVRELRPGANVDS